MLRKCVMFVLTLLTLQYQSLSNSYLENVKKLLSENQYNDVQNHIKQHGNLLSLYELQTIDSFGKKTITDIKHFLNDKYFGITDKWNGIYSLEDEDSIIFNKLFNEESDKHFKITVRYSIPNSENKYVRNFGKIEEVIGSTDEAFFRLRYKNKHIDFGISGEKKPGEMWTPDTMSLKGPHRYLFNKYSFHFQLLDIGFIKNIIVGDYEIGYGQGAVFNSEFGLSSKPLDPIAIVKVSHDGAIPHNSCYKNKLRGVATTLRYKKTELLLFGAYNFLDGNIKKNIISSIRRQETYNMKWKVDQKDKINEIVYGTTMIYKLNNNCECGITFVGMKFLAYKLFDGYNSTYKYVVEYEKVPFGFKRDNNRNLSIFGRYLLGPAHCFIECATSNINSVAINTGGVINIIKQLDAFILFRKYSDNYYNFYGRAFKENEASNCSSLSGCGNNEIGLYSGLLFKPLFGLSILGSLDIFRVPSGNEKHQGLEVMCKTEYSFNKEHSIAFQLKNKQKRSLLKFANGKMVDTYRIKIASKNNFDIIEFDTQVHFTINGKPKNKKYRNINRIKTFGVGIMEKVNINIKSFIISPYALLTFSDNDSDLHIVEPNVLYKNSIASTIKSSFFKFGIVLGYKFKQGIRIEGRLSYKHYIKKLEKKPTNVVSFNVQCITEF